MLLKFTTVDMLNTALVDVSTGLRVYDIATVLLPPCTEAEKEIDFTSVNETPVASSSSLECRHTRITDSCGNSLVSISWSGRHPDITILDEKIGGLTDLFGSTTVRFMPKILAIPTRFDTEYIWTATPNSLTLFDYDSDAIKGTFYQNSIRLPASFKTKNKTPSFQHAPSSSSLSPPSLTASNSSSTSSSALCSASFSSLAPQPPPHTDTPKSSFIPTRLPGLGGNYLEFSSHPLAHDVEIIISFLMMEILRRGRFALTPYTFEKPKMWQLKETRDLVLRRLRRNTV
ncbi:hypothetical protein BDZ94DRAFT_1152278 [Collybia nuda]|uniref:Uncharacterized protein n=1 Tax=Collybia nuda TaxID=64659 RepID=A0A9P5YKN2_9AGAR|nr:hypothetical protein BDZ94DRAFT_1152278 [Collybia nuda]